VYFTGFLIWFAVEAFLQLMGIRALQEAYLFGLPIPPLVQAMLRGGFEGALIATLGIFFADGFLAKGKERWVHLALFAMLLCWVAIRALWQALPEKEVGGEVLSRRDMLNPVGLVLLFSAMGLVVFWYKKMATIYARQRATYMYFTMVCIALAWNIIEFNANTRWIEAGTFTNPERAAPLVELAAFTWDTLIEIAMAYMPFLIIPYYLKLIR
jgi:hypothetical protein